MPGKVVFEVIKGEAKGKQFEYENPDRVFVGRQDDCGILLPEQTVSRYHCLLDINPPLVKLQDFGSLNGTFLNGEKIGQRDRDQSWEEAKSNEHEEYDLHNEDVIRLGKSCEIKCSIEQPDVGLITISEEWEEEDLQQTVMEDADNNVAGDVKDHIQEEKPAEPVPEQIKCKSCGKLFVPKSPENTLCEECRKDKEKVIEDILGALLGGIKDEKPAPAAKPAPAVKIIGPSPVDGYDKVALLGKGGMGEVWKVREKSTGKFYALKLMLPQIIGDKNAERMFLREAKLSEFLVHENVVRTYKTGSSNGAMYIIMDLCEGGSVEDLMKKYGGKLPLNLATYITLQVLSGLDYVHNADVESEIKKRGLFTAGMEKVTTKGVVHRDFKPANIFLSDKTERPVAKVADFGMAKAFETAGLTNMSSNGAVKGTVPFMPRQQALNCRYSKPEVDVWAAAASYYYMLTGQFPKNFRPGGNMWQAIVTESAVPIRDRDYSVPRELARVIDAALVEKPEIGCKSASEFRRNIIKALPEDTKLYCRGLI